MITHLFLNYIFSWMKRGRNKTEYQAVFQWKSTLKSLLVLQLHIGIWIGILNILQ